MIETILKEDMKKKYSILLKEKKRIEKAFERVGIYKTFIDFSKKYHKICGQIELLEELYPKLKNG